MDTKLILVDGMPGTGKSTVSQFINLQLRDRGLPSNWYHEEAIHPVRQFYDPARHRTCSGYTDDIASLWLRYTDELVSQNRIAVLDAALLQTHVRSMLIFDAERNAIVDLAHRVDTVIARLNPILVYLKPKSVEQNFRDVVQSRGKRMLDLWVEAHDQYPYTLNSTTTGYQAFIDFWKEFGQIGDTIFEKLSMSRFRQRASNDNWEARFLQICEFLNLPKNVAARNPFDFARFVGDYELLDDDTSPGFRLLLRDGCLVALVRHPTFDPNRGPIVRFGESRLVPSGDTTCVLAEWPHVVHFTESGLGSENVQAIVRREDSSETGEVYVRRGPSC